MKTTLYLLTFILTFYIGLNAQSTAYFSYGQQGGLAPKIVEASSVKTDTAYSGYTIILPSSCTTVMSTLIYTFASTADSLKLIAYDSPDNTN